MASYLFPEIYLEHECNPEFQLGNPSPFLNSILTPVSLPSFNHFSEPTLDHVPTHNEIESPIFQDQHIEHDQYLTFESPINKLTSFHFYEIELKEEFNPFFSFGSSSKF